MIGNGYWSTGITLTYQDGMWGASLKFLDDGFLDNDPDAGKVSTEGTLHTRYPVRDGDELDGLTAAIDALMADAQRLGIRWRRMPGVAPACSPMTPRSPVLGGRRGGVSWSTRRPNGWAGTMADGRPQPPRDRLDEALQRYKEGRPPEATTPDFLPPAS